MEYDSGFGCTCEWLRTIGGISFELALESVGVTITGLCRWLIGPMLVPTLGGAATGLQMLSLSAALGWRVVGIVVGKLIFSLKGFGTTTAGGTKG